MKAYPSTRLGWYAWYVKRFNDTGNETAATQAVWFQLNILAFGERSYSPGQKESA